VNKSEAGAVQRIVLIGHGNISEKYVAAIARSIFPILTSARNRIIEYIILTNQTIF
jgi:hypothetical protein